MSAVMMLALLAGMTSCDDNKVSVNYTFSVTKDLMQFVTPTMTYTDANGDVQQWVLTEQNSMNSNDLTLSWTQNVTIKDFDKADAGLTVSYQLKEGVETLADTYVFGHKIYLNEYKVWDKTGHLVNSGVFGHTGMVSGSGQSSDGSVTVTIGVDTRQVKADAVQAYLNDLVANPDKYQFDVDSKGNVTSPNISISTSK